MTVVPDGMALCAVSNNVCQVPGPPPSAGAFEPWCFGGFGAFAGLRLST
jgi:hypothetical protein